EFRRDRLGLAAWKDASESARFKTHSARGTVFWRHSQDPSHMKKTLPRLSVAALLGAVMLLEGARSFAEGPAVAVPLPYTGVNLPSGAFWRPKPDGTDRPQMAWLQPHLSDYLWLHVSGATIRTSPAAKNPNSVFVPMGAAYAPGPGGLNSDDYKKHLEWFKAHGCNCFRMVLWTMSWDGHTPYPSDVEFLHRLNTYWDPMIQYARQARIYVVIDDHEFMMPPPRKSTTGSAFLQTDPSGSGSWAKRIVYWTPETIALWQKRWGMVAKKYADNPMVLGYELMNEPHDWGDNVDTPRQALIGAIQAIRKYDQKHIVLIPCDEWEHSRALERMWGRYLATQGNPDPLKNAVFAFHDYPHDNDPPAVRASISAFMQKHNVPVMCT